MLLAIETSSDYLSVVLHDGHGVVSTFQSPSPRTHAERLVPAIRQLLLDANLTVKNLEAIAVSLGPGSYTGLRIGLSTAKGYSMAQNIPIIGVSTFEALASSPVDTTDICYVLIPARKDEWYVGVVRDSKSFSKPVESGIAKLEDVAARVDAEKDQVRLVTSNATALRENVRLSKSLTSITEVQPHAGLVAHVASVRASTGNYSSLHDLEPDYGREFKAGIPSNIFRRLESRLSQD